VTSNLAPKFSPLAPLPLLALPWLNPFTSGPNSSVTPYLLTWLCASAVLLWWYAVPQTNAQRVHTVVGAWTVAACASAVLGLMQYFDASRQWAPWVNQAGLGQAFGNLRQRNQFATLCSIGVCALCWWAQRPTLPVPVPVPLPLPVPVRRPLLPVGLILALAALLGAAVAASGSRTGLLQLVVLTLITARWARASTGEHALALGTEWQWRGEHRRAVRWLVPVALLAYGLAAIALPRLAGVDGSVLDRFHETSAQCNSRLNLWRNVLYLISQKPLWGWGWGELDYAHFITLYDAPWTGLRFCEILDNAHNLPLHLAVELGLPVALLLCGALVGWLVRHRPWREAVPERQLAWAVLAVIGLHSLLEYPLWYGQFQVAALLCLWLLRVFPGAGAPGVSPLAALTTARVPSSPTNGAARWGWAAALASAAIAAASWGVGMSYWRASQPFLAPDERAPQYRQQSWEQLRENCLFCGQVDFAELAVTPVTPQTAQRLLVLAEDVLHFSPEPMVLQKLLQSAQILGREAEVSFYAPRFAAAYPEAYAGWSKGHPTH